TRNTPHPNEEKPMAPGGKDPPPPATLFGTEEAGRAKAAGLQKPTEAIAPRGLGEPLRDRTCFLTTFGTEHPRRTHLLRPLTREELAESVHYAIIGGAIRFNARHPDDERSRVRWTRYPRAYQRNMRGVYCPFRRCDRPYASIEARSCWRRSGDPAHGARPRCA